MGNIRAGRVYSYGDHGQALPGYARHNRTSWISDIFVIVVENGKNELKRSRDPVSSSGKRRGRSDLKNIGGGVSH
jgi:hypothetical protein